MQADLICIYCKHFNGKEFNCQAFTVKIPDIIISGENDHSKPLQTQKNNIVFSPLDIKKKE